MKIPTIEELRNKTEQGKEHVRDTGLQDMVQRMYQAAALGQYKALGLGGQPDWVLDPVKRILEAAGFEVHKKPISRGGTDGWFLEVHW